MNTDRFAEWLRDLPLQTLTDELKESIRDKVELILLQERQHGY